MPINYNSKMSRQYTQKPTSNLPWNWTDQRVQEIMKKYEQPLPSPRCQERTPLRNRNGNYPSDQCDSGSKSPWKQNYYKLPPSRQECTPTPQNKTFDPYSKENSYERSDRSRGMEGGRSSKGMRYKGEGEVMTSIYDCTPKSKENELLDAKNYLREQERKYLKIDMPQMPQREIFSWKDREDSNWREDYKRRDEGRRRERPEWNPKEDSSNRDRQVSNWRQRDLLRSQKMKTQCPQQTLGKDYGRKDLFKDVEYEPRINNIQRINNKIKKILESAQEDKAKVHESTTIELKPTSNHAQATPISINKKPQQTKEGSAVRECSIYESSGKKIEQRSKSCLALKKNVNIQSPCELSQKVNDQLARFNHKISQLQEQKRKLNISFKNGENSALPITSPMQLAQNKQTRNNDNNDQIPLSPLTNTHQESSNQEDEQVSPNFHSPYIGLKDLDSRDDSLCLESNEQLQQITRNMELRRRQREAQAESSPQRKPSVETNRLMAMLSEQVQLDQQLQLAKKWFARCAQESDWALLQELLAQRWRQMTNEELQTEFSITLDEEDPFYSYRPDEFELEDLVANYIICCRHWGEKVEGQWSGGQLRGQECFKKLDRDSRGEAGVQDLVRQINLSQEVFYRNRNLYLILQRLTNHGASRLTEDKFYSVLAKK